MSTLTEDYLKSKGFNKINGAFEKHIGNHTIKVIKNGDHFLPKVLCCSEDALSDIKNSNRKIPEHYVKIDNIEDFDNFLSYLQIMYDVN